MADGIAAFWSWWKTARRRVDRAIEAQELGDLADEITEKVRAIDPGLKWELGGGEGKKHAFALTWDGDIERRRTTERWLAGAPAKDETWEYHPARPAGEGWEHLVMELGPHKVDFSGFTCTFEVDEARERVNACIFHPSLVKAPEHARGTAAFVMLDRAFGEDGVERWIGVIDLAKKKPEGARPIADLVKAVTKLAASATGERCALFQGTRDGAPIFIMKNEALKPIDHLDCDAQLAITIGLEAPTDEGLPSEKESVVIDALEDALVADLDGHAAYHGRETCGGARTLYFFAPRKGHAAEHVAKWKKKQKRRITISWTPDEKWEGLERWS